MTFLVEKHTKRNDLTLSSTANVTRLDNIVNIVISELKSFSQQMTGREPACVCPALSAVQGIAPVG